LQTFGRPPSNGPSWPVTVSRSPAPNGLLRQYLPKGIDISNYSQAKLNAVARQLNERPRKTLGYQTPAEMFSHTVALTG
jgi:IS30 family transposase